MPLAASRPIEREPKDVEGCRTFAALLTRRRTPEGKKTRFVWMQSQTEMPQSFSKHVHHTTRVIFVFKANHEVVGVFS
jgi:hypothetical protein